MKQVPEDPDVFFTDLSDSLLSLDLPFTGWLERTSGEFDLCYTEFEIGNTRP